MALFNATITFGLPDNTGSDVLQIHESTSKNGTYSLKISTNYQYGITDFYAVELNDARWYKIRFYNSESEIYSPFSEPVYGGTWTAAAPFLAISSASDGANYATTEEVYEYANLTTEDISASRVSAALKRARSLIDLRTSEMDFGRFNDFDDDTARRKYNATLRIIKEAEINFALASIYQNLCDDRIIENMRENASSKVGSISIGGVSIGGDDLADRNESLVFLRELSARYEATAEKLLANFDTNSVKLTGYDLAVRVPKFRYPFNGWV